MDAIFTLKYYLIVCALALCSCTDADGPTYDYTHPIPYAPEHYVCHRSAKAPSIDGVISQSEWGLISWSKLFVDIEGRLKPLPMHDTRVKMMWDSVYLYIAAQVTEDHIWATLKQRDTIIFQNNNFEVFIDPDGDTHNYIELEINALNTVWDLLLLRPYREDTLPKVDNAWNIEGLQTAVYIEGTLNDASDIDQFWSLEIAIPLKSIIEFTPSQKLPQQGEQWRINFSRVAWHVDVTDGRYVKKKGYQTGNVPYFPQENWVWSPSGRVNMHQPETWGYLQFSEYYGGSKRDSFIIKEEEKIKWGLRQLYFQQKKSRTLTGSYDNNIQHFDIATLDIARYSFAPEVTVDSTDFEFRASDIEGNGYWAIRQDGRVWFVVD